MIRVKLSASLWDGGTSLEEYIGCKNNTIDGVRFYINPPRDMEFDFWFVVDDINGRQESTFVNPKRIYYFTAETIQEPGFFDTSTAQSFLGQFFKIFTSHDIYTENAFIQPPFQAWMINANHGFSDFFESRRGIDYLSSLKRLEKTGIISVICSNKAVTPFHHLRLKFVSEMKKVFKDKVHWYGNGISPIPSKWDGIAPYKYHLCIENKSQNNSITEKLLDSYLGLSFPIYWGAPNVSEYFPSKSFQLIDIFDRKKSIQVIEKIISTDPYDNVLPCLLKARDSVLNELNPFKRMANIARTDYYDLSYSSKSTVTLNSLVSQSPQKILSRKLRRLCEHFIK